jgi:carbonic anhydrase
MDELRHGVLTFQEHVFPKHERMFQRLSTGQTPKAFFITCADSRVDPAMITNSPAGQLFVDRNAGNFIPPYHGDNASESANIEYALRVLGIPNIIICGHTDCGAMKGVWHPEKVAELPAVSRWLTNGEEARKRAMELNLPEEEQLMAITQQNVIVQLEHIQTYPVVREHLDAGKLQLAGWVYDIGNGKVWEYNAAAAQFEPLVAS